MVTQVMSPRLCAAGEKEATAKTGPVDPAEPSLEVKREGNAVCSVRRHSKSSTITGPTLVREIDIRPTGEPRKIFTPPGDNKDNKDSKDNKQLRLRVHERDYYRCAGDIEALKDANLDKAIPEVGIKIGLPGTRLSRSQPFLARRRSIGNPEAVLSEFEKLRQQQNNEPKPIEILRPMRRRSSLPRILPAMNSENTPESNDKPRSPKSPVDEKPVLRDSGEKVVRRSLRMRTVASFTTL